MNIEKINNTELTIKEYHNMRIVTFKDIDAVHQRPEGTAKRNFSTNKKHFIKGEDFFIISKKEVGTDFVQTYGFSENAPSGTIITESGYLMLVKSFTDDLAWKVQRDLVNNYFRAKSVPSQSYIPERASIPAPRRPDWYIKNKERIFEICERKGVEPKRLYYYLIRKLGQTYDLATAREVYKHDRGCYPEYDIDVIGYFPELSEAADKLLERMEL